MEKIGTYDTASHQEDYQKSTNLSVVFGLDILWEWIVVRLIFLSYFPYTLNRSFQIAKGVHLAFKPLSYLNPHSRLSLWLVFQITAFGQILLTLGMRYLFPF